MPQPVPDIITIRRAIAERDRDLRLLRAIDRAMTRYRVTSLPDLQREDRDGSVDRTASREGSQ